jgi:hypothetical protein
LRDGDGNYKKTGKVEMGEFLLGVLMTLGDILPPTPAVRWFIGVVVAILIVAALIYLNVISLRSY